MLSGKRASNACLTCPGDWDNLGKLRLILDTLPGEAAGEERIRDVWSALGWGRVPSGSW